MSDPRELQKYNNIYRALLWSLMDISDQQLKTGLLMTGVGILLGGLWLLEGTLSPQMRSFHLNSGCLFICKLTRIIAF